MKDEPIYPIDAKVEYQLHPDKDGYVEKKLGHFGLTKREYFAGKAMEALISSCLSTYPNRQDTAKKALEYADALIEALEKNE